MRRLVPVLAVLVAAGCGGGRPSSWTETFRSCAKQTPPCIDAFDMHRRGERSDSQSAALRIARRNSLASGLISGPGAALRASFDWADLEGKRIGVGLVYDYRRPVQIHEVLPYVESPPDAPAHGDCVEPYAPGWLKVDSSSVTGLSVYVDLGKRQVVDLSPYVEDGTIHYAWVPGKPHPDCEEDEAG